MKATDYKTQKQAHLYEVKRFSGGLGQVSKDELDLVTNLFVKLDPKEKIYADIGAGTGRALETILKFKPKMIYAIDQSPAMLSQLQKMYRSKKVKIINADAQDIPLKAGSIQRALCLHVLKHISSPQEVFLEVSRLLAPKGYFLFDVLNTKSIVRFNLGTCFALDEKLIKKYLQAAGFKPVEVKYLHSLGETTYNIFGGRLAAFIRILDLFISRVLPKTGTKIFILAQKDG